MSKIITYVVCLIIFFSCNKYNKQNEVRFKDSIQKISLDILPDTTINGKLILEESTSIKKMYNGNTSLIDYIRESPVILFSNKGQSQYLLAYQYEGNTKNSFSCFEIGYFNDEEKFKDYKYSITKENNFLTESGIGLGTSLEDLIKKKGNNYSAQVESDTIIIYQINDYNESVFLQKYNMPSYFMKFKIKNNKIINILLGFDYP